MKRIYVAANNAVNYVIIVDWERPEDEQAIIYDLDLSDEELKEIFDKFQSGELDMDDAWGEWTSEEDAFDELFFKKELDYYLEELEDE